MFFDHSFFAFDGLGIFIFFWKCEAIVIYT